MTPQRCALLAAALLVIPAAGRARDGFRVLEMSGLPLVLVPGGSYQPLYPASADTRQIEVAPVLLMTRPVTNAEFLAFTASRPEYRRDRIARVFADERYLSRWAAPAELGAAVRPQQPVTHVSWFAAKAFCESHGLRLPTEAEWERAAAASATRADGRADPAFRARQLAWFSAPNGELPDVPHGPPNLHGARDLHGVVWEWVLDFNNAIAIDDSRNQGGDAADRFCGGAALLASDTTDYATFMRLAMRSSLQADYATANLGFRCAADPDVTKENEP